MLKHQSFLPQVLSISGCIKRGPYGAVLEPGQFSILTNDSAHRKGSTQGADGGAGYEWFKTLLQNSEQSDELRKQP